MRRFAAAALLLTVSVTTTHTQDALTRDQRVDDLTQLASFYAKNYAPYEWKRQTQDFDLLRLNPWLQRIRHADDLEFHERLIEYVASLNDAHDLIAFPTTFSVSLPMAVDIYDGKVLIEALNPAVFPGAQRGDELVSIDGRSVQSLIASFRKYAIAANRRSTDRVAASRLVIRSQQIMPHISDLGDTAKVVIKLAATGAINTLCRPVDQDRDPGHLARAGAEPPRRQRALVPSTRGADPRDGAGRARGGKPLPVRGHWYQRQYAAVLYGADSRAAQRQRVEGVLLGIGNRQQIPRLRSACRDSSSVRFRQA